MLIHQYIKISINLQNFCEFVEVVSDFYRFRFGQNREKFKKKMIYQNHFIFDL